MTETYAASDVAEAGAAGGLDRLATLNAVRRYERIGCIRAAERGAGGRNAAYLFDREQAAVGLILAGMAQRAEIVDASRLRALAKHLTADTGGGVPYVARILRDVEDGGQPCVGVSIFTHAEGNRSTVFSIRLDAERSDPVQPPGVDCVAWVAGALELAPLLRAFVAAPERVH